MSEDAIGKTVLQADDADQEITALASSAVRWYCYRAPHTSKGRYIYTLFYYLILPFILNPLFFTILQVL